MNVFPLSCAFLGGLFLATLGLATRGPAQERPASPSDSDAVQTDSSAARIVTEVQGDLLRVSGAFTNGGGLPDTLAYRLSVERDGASGTSTSRQSGFFETATGQTDTLSTSQVNVREGDRLHLRLTILEGDRLVAEDVIDKTYP